MNSDDKQIEDDNSFNIDDLDFTKPEAVKAYAKQLVGMTFNDILDLGIKPDDSNHDYNRKNYKGGLGTLIEERYFGYAANSSSDADFAEAKIELKSTPIDRKKDGSITAGERLVLSMIPFDGPVDDEFYDSHVWEKCRTMLLVFYERDKTKEHLNQRIKYVYLFTPPEEDLEIIRSDYKKIVSLIQDGRAEELSEGLTDYLGACTKGATAEKSLTSQYYPPHTLAKRRAFSLKRQYMDYVLHHYVMNEEAGESIVENATSLEDQSFEEYVLGRIERYVGKTDEELCEILGMPYKANKAQWSQIVYRLLGVNGNKADEFEKANISVRTVRIEESGGIRESISLNTFSFLDLVGQDWEDSELCQYFEETRFLFVSFKKETAKDGKKVITLAGARFWGMPATDIDGPLRQCWEQTRDIIKSGVELVVKRQANGKVYVSNNFPKASENPVCHVRPHATQSAYVLEDGVEIGNPNRDALPLPDGRKMTKQSFWLNSNYVYSIVKI